MPQSRSGVSLGFLLFMVGITSRCWWIYRATTEDTAELKRSTPTTNIKRDDFTK
eukprot:m.645840 g.645840  ORF g.645840 m.645840 type:complete len:54 (+) comp58360_c1_seq2:4189-4350(+)